MMLGDAYSWQPSAFMENGWRTGKKNAQKDTVRGRIIHINAAHRGFTAEAVVNGHTLRESFKF